MVKEKAQERARIRALRRAMTPGERDRESLAASALCAQLGSGEPLSYAAIPDELDLSSWHQTRWATGLAVVLPRVAGPGLLSWHRITGPEQLEPGSFGIPEPGRDAEPWTIPHESMVFVPGVAFTAAGLRLGQGGGYYDRFLAERLDLLVIGVGFTCQLVEDIPCEGHDRLVDGLVIADRLVRSPRRA